jgi:Zn-dependent protease
MLDGPFDVPILALIWYAVFVLSCVLHEAAHAFAARWLGDATAYLGGQVTLNPRPHIEREPLGMVLVPLASFLFYGWQAGGDFRRGWMMGWASAPYDPHWAATYPRRAATMALAGPLANLLLALLAAGLMTLGLAAGWFRVPDHATGPLVLDIAAELPAGLWPLAAAVSILLVLNVVLLVFNLFPAPPLDGAAVVMLLLPLRQARRWQAFVRQPTISMLGLVAALIASPHLAGGALRLVLRVLLG